MLNAKVDSLTSELDICNNKLVSLDTRDTVLKTDQVEQENQEKESKDNVVWKGEL